MLRLRLWLNDRPLLPLDDPALWRLDHPMPRRRIAIERSGGSGRFGREL
jgi:hypothetical protein